MNYAVYRIEITGRANGEVLLSFSFDGEALSEKGNADINYIISIAQELKKALEKLRPLIQETC